jgi:hypothetical protein
MADYKNMEEISKALEEMGNSEHTNEFTKLLASMMEILVELERRINILEQKG